MKKTIIEKILFLTNDYPPAEGRMETCAFEISEEIKKSGLNIEVMVCRVCRNSAGEIESAENIIRLNPPKFYLLKIAYLFFKILKRIFIFKPDIIFLNTWSPFGLPALIISKIFRIPYIVSSHGLDVVEPLNSAFHTRNLGLVLNGAAHICCNSAYTKNLVIKHNPQVSNKITVINNGINISKFKPLDKNKCKSELGFNNRFIMLTVARMTPRKGHLQVIEKIVSLKDSIPEILYVIAGRGGIEQELKEKVREMKLEEYVHFSGFIDDALLPVYYSAGDVFVMLSDELLNTGDVEGFGVSYLEANACARPAIGLNKGGTTDAIKNGITGFLLESVDEFNNIILKLYKEPELLESLSKSSLSYAIQNCQWANRVCEYLKVMKK